MIKKYICTQFVDFFYSKARRSNEIPSWKERIFYKRFHQNCIIFVFIYLNSKCLCLRENKLKKNYQMYFFFNISWLYAFQDLSQILLKKNMEREKILKMITFKNSFVPQLSLFTLYYLELFNSLIFWLIVFRSNIKKCGVLFQENG